MKAKEYINQLLNEDDKFPTVEYRDFTIRQDSKPIEKKNKISGHSWVEYEGLQRYIINNKNISPRKTFKTLDDAKKYIDYLYNTDSVSMKRYQ